MKLLLDTHTFIWALEKPTELNKTTYELISDLQNEIFVSSVSLWELAIKVNIAKIKLSKPLDIFIDSERKIAKIKVLNYDLSHIKHYASLPIPKLTANTEHRDPFDRMIICQSIVEKIPVISKDSKFGLYQGLQLIW
jgi:PIN domain nuclease of toxin-antitoxin system